MARGPARREHGGMTPQDPTPPDPPPLPPPEPPETPPPPTPRRLLRTSSDKRMLAGVAGGLGRPFDPAPGLARVAFVVLALFGGSGVALYAILWLILPSEERPARIRTDSPRSHKIALI